MDTTQNLRSKISNEMLSCLICFEYYKDPKSLPCLHTFCKECLDSYVTKKSGQKDNVDVPCPICRKSTTIPSGGVDGLPDNFTYKNLAEMVGLGSVKSNNNTCDNCDDSKIAIAKCVECDELLCAECKHAHSLVKITRDHKIKSLNEGVTKPKKIASEDATSMKSWVCDNHREKITCFCFHCSQPVCPFCISEMVSEKDPKKHEFVGLSEAVAQLQLTIDKSLEGVLEKKGELEEKIQMLADVDEALTESTNKTKAAIKDRAQEIQRIMDKWSNRQQKELEVQFRKNKDEIMGRKHLLEGYLDKLVRGTSEITEQLKTGDPHILLRKKDLVRQTHVFKDTATFNTQDLPDSMTISLPEVKDIPSITKPLLTDISVEKQGPLKRFDSLSSLGSVGGAEAGTTRAVQVRCSLVSTARLQDVKVYGMAVGKYSGDLFVVNPDKREVGRYKIEKDGQFKYLQAYGGKVLKEPLDVDQLPDGRLVVSDGKEGHSVKIFNLVTSKYEANIAHILLKKACGITTTSDGHIVVTDVDEKAVYVLKLNGQSKFSVVSKIAEHDGKPQFDSPQYVASFHNTIVVSDKNRNYVKAFNLNAGFRFQFGRFGNGKLQLKKPEGICCDKEGRVYIADVQNNRIQILTNRGRHISYVRVNQICGKFYPFPSMLGITADQRLLLMNDDGWIKVVDVQFIDSSDEV